MSGERYITTWRETGDKVLVWDHHVSESLREAQRVVENITARGVHQFATYPLGEQIKEMSSAY